MREATKGLMVRPNAEARRWRLYPKSFDRVGIVKKASNHSDNAVVVDWIGHITDHINVCYLEPVEKL